MSIGSQKQKSEIGLDSFGIPKKSLFGVIFRYTTRSDFPVLFAGVLFTVLAALGSPIQTYLYGKAFGKLAVFLKGESSATDFINALRLYCGAMIAVGGGRMILTWASIFTWLLVGERAQLRAREHNYMLLMLKSIEWLETKENLLASLTSAYRCIEEIREGVSENMYSLLQITASVAFLMATAFVALWSLTLVVFCCVPLMGLSSYVFGRLTAKYAKRENLLNAHASKILDWCFQSGDLVRSLNGKDYDLVDFGHVVDESALAFTRMAYAICANTAILRFLSNIVILAGLAFGRFLVSTNRMTLAAVFTAFSACLLLGAQISSVAEVLAYLNKAKAASDTIDTFGFGENVAEASHVESSLALPMSTLSAFSGEKRYTKIEFKHAFFHYAKKESLALDNLTMDFDSSRLNFVVGESGSGKSTVALLMAGFLHLSDGLVSIDGVSYRDLPPDWFTDNICFIELKPLIFETLLAENLLMGIEDPDFRLLERACEFADLNDYVESLPEKFATSILSKRLSGGQIQKIGLARAWLQNKPILIMDESLSSVNYGSRKLLMANIRRWRQDMLTVIITHDLSDVAPGDHVIVVKAGKATESEIDVYPGPEFLLEDEKNSILETTDDLAASLSRDYLDNPAVLKDLESKGVMDDVERTVPMSLLKVIRLCFRTCLSKGLILFGVFVSIITGLMPPALSYCYLKVLSAMVSEGSDQSSVITLWCVLITGISLAELLVTFVSKLILNYCSEAWIVALRKAALCKINDQDMSFFGNCKPTYLNTLLMNDLRDLRNLISEFYSGVFLVVTLTLVGVAAAVTMGWNLALVGISFIPLVYIVMIIYGILLQKYETAYKDHVAGTESFSQLVISGVRTVRSFGIGQYLSTHLRDKLERLYNTGCKRAVVGGFGIAVQELCSSAATATVLYYGMTLVALLLYTQSQMLEVLTMLTFTISSASHLMKLMPEIARGQRAATMITRILDLDPLIVECEGTLTSTKAGGPFVVLKNVSFSYSDPKTFSFKPVLRNFDLTIEKGGSLVLTGECGCGKSTLGLLLTRLLSPDRGGISLGGHSISEYSPEWYRKSVGLVTQKPKFFEASIWDNLVYGMEKLLINDNFVLECLRAANALDFVDKLPKGWATIIGKEGQFSLGQLQRLSIARTLIRKPKFIIFDEPTTHLDAENTRVIIDLISHGVRDIDPALTTMVITHDRAVMQEFPRVVMLKGGTAVEEGSYEQLMQKGQHFYHFMK